jgi:hypothetical protein
MKPLVTLLLILISFNGLSQFNTLNTSTQEDNYSDLEVNTLYQINFIRILNKLKPLRTNKTLNHYSKYLNQTLQRKNIDTLITNTILVYYDDSVSLDHQILKDTLDFIGISTLTHQYKCNLMIITLDKRKEQIVWKDLDCPKDKKKKKWFKILN